VDDEVMETQQEDVVAQTVIEAFLDGPDSSKVTLILWFKY
jgi:hypothetical protein